MRADLMIFTNHTLYQSSAIVREDIVPVSTIDKERGTDVVVLERVQDLTCEPIRSIIEGQGNSSWDGATLDDRSNGNRRGLRCNE